MEEENNTEQTPAKQSRTYWKKWDKAKHPLPVGTEVKKEDGETGVVSTAVKADDGSLVYNIHFPSGNTGEDSSYRYK